MELSRGRKLIGSVCYSCGATFLHCQFIGEMKCFECGCDNKQFHIGLLRDFSLFIVHVLDPHEGECAYIGVANNESEEECIKIPCYVTEDGIRILSSSRMQYALRLVDVDSDGKIVKGTSGTRLGRLFNYKDLKPLFSNDFNVGHFNPISCKHGKSLIKGYEASVLVDLCSIVLKARRDGLLKGKRQTKIAERCEILQGGFARLGIIALIDEATGYQEIRDKKALQAYLDLFLNVFYLNRFV